MTVTAPMDGPSGIVWPELPRARSAPLLAMLFQLEQTQWWPPERIREHQFHQLCQLVQHAQRCVPFYGDRLDSIPRARDSAELQRVWHHIPILSRTDVQQAGAALHASPVPRDHGRTFHRLTSGSTGQPLRCLGTSVTRFFWRTITLRDHLWHRRDLTGRLAAIRYTRKNRAMPPAGTELPDWGAPASHIARTGPSFLLSTDSTVSEQAAWLERVDPTYLIAYPSNLMALADRFLETGQRLDSLRQIRAFGECLDPKVRARCRQAWDVPVTDCYSSQEVGYVALECPEEKVYHIQSESCLVEVLHGDGTPCEVGETGRVVVTPLHNAAMPLIRYDLHDFAEVGPPCPCGRGLPVLRRVVGRERNMLLLPGGERRWPGLGHGENLDQLPPIRQYQIVQTALDQIELRLAQPAPFGPEQEARIAAYLQQTLGHPFRIAIRYVDRIERAPSGKFEEFRCDVEN